MSHPLVSIIIPTYNRSEILSQTLDSVQNQSFKEWECLIVDDNSIDHTEELVQFYLKDNRFKYFKLPKNIRKGANSCRNFGFHKSIGSFIQWLDSDDLITAEKLERQVALAIKMNADLCTCKWGRFYFSNKLQIEKNLPSYADFNDPFTFFETLSLSKGYFPIHAYLMKRAVVEKAGLWAELEVNQDGEFMSRIIISSNKIIYSNKGAALYRFNDGIGNYENNRKAKDLLLSWMVIEQLILKSFPLRKSHYLRKSKSQVLLVLRDYKWLALKNFYFFRNVEKHSLKLFLKSFFN